MEKANAGMVHVPMLATLAAAMSKRSLSSEQRSCSEVARNLHGSRVTAVVCEHSE